MAVFLTLVFLLFSSSAIEAATVYLKNGSVIRDVTDYEKVDGKVRMKVYGGILEISAEDVEKIEAGETPPAERLEPARSEGQRVAPKPYTPVETYLPPEEPKPDPRLLNIETRLKQIEKETGELDGLKKDYDRIRLRIEVLFQKGIKRARAAGKDDSQWLNFLDSQERFWVQTNTLKKKQMEKEASDADARLAELAREKEALLKEKAEIEGLAQ